MRLNKKVIEEQAAKYADSFNYTPGAPARYHHYAAGQRRILEELLPVLEGLTNRLEWGGTVNATLDAARSFIAKYTEGGHE